MGTGSPAPGLLAEVPRLSAVGAVLLGICGDANHTYGYHINSGRLPASDYSMQGAANRPVGDYCCAIDVGMGWPASRAWLRWLIAEIAADRIRGIAEVIGSYDGRDVRYWSDDSGWAPAGVPYQGSGHDTWTHIGIYRSTALADHRLLAGWTATGLEGAGGDMELTDRVRLVPLGAVAADSSIRPDIAMVDLLAFTLLNTETLRRQVAALTTKLEVVLGEVDQVEELLAALPASDPDQLAQYLAEQLGDRLTPELLDALTRIRISVADPEPGTTP
ncbi:MAG TPA: hypothetical protein VGJ44_19390 [Kribbellaceae bacterium]|jgi:hypothetical protein